MTTEELLDRLLAAGCTPEVTNDWLVFRGKIPAGIALDLLEREEDLARLVRERGLA